MLRGRSSAASTNSWPKGIAGKAGAVASAPRSSKSFGLRVAQTGPPHGQKISKRTPKDDQFLVITGLSGSGKTVFSHFLEDLGYYCIDNLPAKLIPNLVDLWQSKEAEIPRLALVVDIREHGFLTDFPSLWRDIVKRVAPRLIFLDASDETLVNRFSESRRPHPLAKEGAILDGVRLERRRLARIKKMADEVFDTTSKTSRRRLSASLCASSSSPSPSLPSSPCCPPSRVVGDFDEVHDSLMHLFACTTTQ